MAATTFVTGSERSTNFTRAAWAVLAWNVLVVLWGAFVRASGSGAGCGSHWPLCNGQVVPAAPQITTIIEFTHRLMSGAALVGVVALWWMSRSRFAEGAPARRMAGASFLFLITEALLGAGLVLFNYVDKDASVGRAAYLSLHLLNTLLLLGALALTAWLADGRATLRRPIPIATGALVLAAVVSVAGAIAALGDTLFPVATLAQGIRQDFSGAANFLIRLRALHPLLAVAAGAYFIALAVVVRRSHGQAVALKLGLSVLVLALAQLLAGVVNLLLLAPVVMQIVHLLLADALWITLVLLAVEARPRVSPEALN